MSGHSRWTQIKRQKGAVDVKRGQLFTKLAREIQVAARQGGPDPDANVKLRLAIQKARDANMPLENIERAIRRGGGTGEGGAELEEVTYEGYGPGGAAILVHCLTDNRNRTVSEVRHTFTKLGGSMAEAGAVTWTFEPKGLVVVSAAGVDPEELALAAIDLDAEDVRVEGDAVEVYTAPERLEAVRSALAQRGVAVESAELTQRPTSTVHLEAETAVRTLRLLDALEERDDVQRVYVNAEFPDSVLAAYAQR